MERENKGMNDIYSNSRPPRKNEKAKKYSRKVRISVNVFLSVALALCILVSCAFYVLGYANFSDDGGTSAKDMVGIQPMSPIFWSPELTRAETLRILSWWFALI